MVKKKLIDVHTKPGEGSIFAKPIEEVVDVIQRAIKDNSANIERVATTTGALKLNVPNIGYDLVLPVTEASKLSRVQKIESGVEKTEGPNKINVPAFYTSAPLQQFNTDQLTVIIRPKKDESGTILPNEFIILSAFPGKDLPRISEWNNKYAVIIPQSSTQQESKTNHFKKTSTNFVESLNNTMFESFVKIVNGLSLDKAKELLVYLDDNNILAWEIEELISSNSSHMTSDLSEFIIDNYDGFDDGGESFHSFLRNLCKKRITDITDYERQLTKTPRGAEGDDERSMLDAHPGAR